MRTWLALGGFGLLLSGAAWAADVLPEGGLIEVLPVGDVLGDGSTPAVVHLLALYENGAPMLGLKLKAEVSAGTPGEVIEVGRGLYRFTVTPPQVDAQRTFKVTVRGRTEDRTAVEASREVAVHPAAGGRIGVTLNPAAVTLGVDASATISFQIPVAGITPPAAEDLEVRMSAGEISSIVALGDGRYTARFTPPRVNYPHLGILTVVDRRQPDVLRGYGVVPLQGKVDYPVQSKPGATVILRLGEREFGPVTAGSDGRALVPIIVPPGLQKATKITVQGGATTQEELDLGVPEGRRLQAFPVAVGVPSDATVKLPVRFVVLEADGTPDVDAALDLTATAGRIGRPVHLGDGVYEAPYTPPDGRVQMAATIQATVPGGTAQSDAAEITLLAALPGRVEVSTEPTQLSADGTGLKVFVRVLAADGTGLSDRQVRVEPAGATLKGPVQDLKGGDYRADLTADGGTNVVVQLVAPPAPSGNALAHVLVLPSAEHLPPDGVTSSALLIATTDAWGYPVPNVPVELAVVEGGGALPSSVTTDAAGLARVYYTAASAAGLVAIEARSGGHVGAAGLVLTGLEDLPDLPPSGTDADLRVQDAWERLRVTTVVQRAGAGGAPVAATVDSAPAGALAALAVTTEPATAAPGGTVKVRIRAADASGRGVAGARFDLLATNGARFGVLNDMGGGDYETTLTIPADATERVRVSVLDPAGATSAILELQILGGASVAANPWTTDGGSQWAGTPTEPTVPPEEEPTRPTRPERGPRPEPSVDRPLFRGRVSVLAASHQYRQDPSGTAGSLLPTPLAWGGDVGGAAVPLGFELNLRGYVPNAEPLGFVGAFRLARYQVSSVDFNEPAKDNLLAAQVAVIGRAPIPIGGSQLSIGARLGFRWDDFITFRGCTEPGCEVSYDSLGVAGLDAGVEISAEFWKMYTILSGRAGFAYFTVPYAANVDLNLGYNITKNLFIDAGFEWQFRKAELEGKESGNVRGTVADQLYGGTFGVGVSF
jgi:hypothetical protein